MIGISYNDRKYRLRMGKQIFGTFGTAHGQTNLCFALALSELCGCIIQYDRICKLSVDSRASSYFTRKQAGQNLRGPHGNILFVLVPTQNICVESSENGDSNEPAHVCSLF